MTEPTLRTRDGVSVGFSLGASVAVRHAGLHRGVDAVVAVSGPSRWNDRGPAAASVRMRP